MSQTRPDGAVRRYVLAVAGAGLALLGGWVAMLGLKRPDVASVVILLGLGVLSVWLPLRFHRGGGIHGFNLTGAVLIAGLFTLPEGWWPLVPVVASMVGYASKVRDPTKVAFNIGQDAIWSVAAATAAFAIGLGPEPTSARSLIVVSLAAAIMVALNAVLLTALFQRLEAIPVGRSPWRRESMPLYAMTYVGNSVYGVILAVTLRAAPVAAALTALLIVGVFLGYRGYAGVIEERTRVEHLHRLSQNLVEATTNAAAFEDFLEGVRRLLGATTAELRVTVGDAHTRIVRSAGEDAPVTAFERADLAAGPLLAPDGRSLLAVPLVHEGRGIGLLALHLRSGLEPWGEEDVTLLRSIANEVAVTVDNVELFAQVERERAHLEEESAKLASILGAASDGIALISGDGEIRSWNPGMEHITGVVAAQALGQPWFVVLRLRDEAGTDLLPDSDHAFMRALSGERFEHALAMQALRRDGQWRWLQCTAAPIQEQDEGRGGIVLVVRDVTSEREVDELKSDFIATVSHELRTPLTPLKGFLSTLERSVEKAPPETLRAAFSAMGTQVARLEALISDLLAVAELDHGQFELQQEPIDLGVAVPTAVELEAAAARCEVSCEPGLMALADPVALTRVIRALVSNALKHTSGTVWVRATATEDEAVVAVTDEGPGIAPWEQKRIFGRFVRLGEHLTRTQGPGLGLPIARSLARRMQGDVTLISDVGQGATFELRLPLARPRAVGASGASAG